MKAKNKNQISSNTRGVCIKIFAAIIIALWPINTPLFASETDDQIQSSAKQTYVFSTYLKDDNIKIDSKDGIVTLTGNVDKEIHKSLAEETVASLPGVKRVDNRIQISGDNENTDPWLATKVKTALLFHRHVSGTKTEVSAQDGVVTLRGEADSESQKDLTTEYAKEVSGVKDVNNEMTVAKKSEQVDETLAEKIDDASITAQVKLALLFHRSTSAIKTKVQTYQGIVTLNGEAKNATEKELAAKVVSDVRGVKNVVNNMTIKEEKVINQ